MYLWLEDAKVPCYERWKKWTAYNCGSYYYHLTHSIDLCWHYIPFVINSIWLFYWFDKCKLQINLCIKLCSNVTCKYHNKLILYSEGLIFAVWLDHDLYYFYAFNCIEYGNISFNMMLFQALFPKSTFRIGTVLIFIWWLNKSFSFIFIQKSAFLLVLIGGTLLY